MFKVPNLCYEWPWSLLTAASKNLSMPVIRTIKEKCPWKKKASWVVSSCEQENELSYCKQYGDIQVR